MPRVYVESWSPEFGSPVERDPTIADLTQVDLDVECPAGKWEPRVAPDDAEETVRAFKTVALIDGVRRVDARLTLDDRDGVVGGICASMAAGAAIWDAETCSAWIDQVDVQRRAIFAGGKGARLPSVNLSLGPQLQYETESVPTTDPAALVGLLQTRMRQFEGELSRQLAQAGYFVVADGPIHPLAPLPLVGYIKSQRAAYLPPEYTPLVARLRPGERTPLFIFDRQRFPRYSWYLRIADVVGGHAWSGVARVECTGSMPTDEALRLAGITAWLLPRFASLPYIDPRAPQNLVPVGALEKELRRLLGDAALIYRALRSAIHRAEVPKISESRDPEEKHQIVESKGKMDEATR